MIRTRSSKSAAVGADDPFGDGVHLRCAYRRLDDLDVDGREDGVEAAVNSRSRWRIWNRKRWLALSM
jgi:hypothetical protein